MNDSLLHKNRSSYFLQPGEVFVTRQKNMTISTVLGSCVAVCLWEKRRKIGGMNHVMLPVFREDEEASTRYANVATYILQEMLRKEGCGKRILSARVFGGASSFIELGSNLGVGARNIEVTFSILNKLGITVIGQDVGGSSGRKIFFDIMTGKIRMNYINNYNFDEENSLNKSKKR